MCNFTSLFNLVCMHGDIMIYISFFKGCNASILLDKSPSEKDVAPNLNSVRGFDVIDKIRQLLSVCAGELSSTPRS